MLNTASNTDSRLECSGKPLLGQSALVEILFDDVIQHLQEHFSKNITINSIVDYSINNNHIGDSIDLTHHIIERVRDLIRETKEDVTSICVKLSQAAKNCIQGDENFETKLQQNRLHHDINIVQDPELEVLAYNYLRQII